MGRVYGGGGLVRRYLTFRVALHFQHWLRLSASDLAGLRCWRYQGQRARLLWAVGGDADIQGRVRERRACVRGGDRLLRVVRVVVVFVGCGVWLVAASCS